MILHQRPRTAALLEMKESTGFGSEHHPLAENVGPGVPGTLAVTVDKPGSLGSLTLKMEVPIK